MNYTIWDIFLYEYAQELEEGTNYECESEEHIKRIENFFDF